MILMHGSQLESNRWKISARMRIPDELLYRRTQAIPDELLDAMTQAIPDELLAAMTQAKGVLLTFNYATAISSKNILKVHYINLKHLILKRGFI